VNAEPKPASPPTLPKVRQAALVILLLAAIGASGFWIYRTEFTGAPINERLHRTIGRVMAEETSRLLNNTGRVVIIAMERNKAPELRAQLAEFEKTLNEISRIRIHETYNLDTGEQPKYAFGSGLSPRRFTRIVNKNQNVDAVVSFVGAPNLGTNDAAEVKRGTKFVALCRSAEKLKKFFETKLIQVAVVSRFQFPNPIQGAPHDARELFTQRFQIVTATNAGDLPSGKSE
jgi:hypothetical protein